MSRQVYTNTGATILRAESISAWHNGEKFLENAKIQAAEIEKQALEEARKAWQQGYEEGRQAGLEDAARLALKITAERDDYLNSLTSRLAQTIDASVRKILGEIEDSELITAVARNAIKEMREFQKVFLRVPLGMAGELEKREVFSRGTNIILQEDDTLQGSMCCLDTPLGIIELGAHTQWELIFKSISAIDRGN